jgi:hypothetical protein
MSLGPIGIESKENEVLVKLIVPQLLKKFPALYGTQRFTAVLISAYDLALS